MKLTALLLTVVFLNAFAAGNAQSVTLSGKALSLQEVLSAVKKQTGYVFFYNRNDLRDARPVSIDAKQLPLSSFLEQVMERQPLQFRIDGKTIVLSRKPVFLPVQLHAVDSAVQDRQPITGSVTDTLGVPLAGATVSIRGKERSVSTDAGGRFTIDADPGDWLVVSYIGYAGITYRVKADTKNLSLVLRVAGSTIEDVVVTGIFNKSKETYTGVARVISEKELRQFQGRNIFTTIGNIDPSFYVVPNNNAGSNPNTIPDIQIRGARSLPYVDQLQDQTRAGLNMPLIILDGFETTMQRMLDLDNNQILSITLLKDGSATALYGSRGANGVVVIRTKEPAPGKLRLTYRMGANLSVPDLTSYHLLGSRDKLELERLSGYYQSATQAPEVNVQLQQYYNEVKTLVEQGINTYWLAKPLRTQLDQTHNIKVEGGDQSFRYDLSLQYNNVNGVMKGSERNAYNGSINLSYRLKNLTFRNNLVIGHTRSAESPYGSYADYARLNPYWKPTDNEGRIVQFFTPFNASYWTQTSKYAGNPHPNPLYDATLNTYDKTNYTSIINNFQLEWIPITHVLVRGGVGITGTMRYRDNFLPAAHSRFADYGEADIFRKGSYDYTSGKEFNYTTNLQVNYSNRFAGVHNVSVGVNLDMQENNNRIYSFKAEGFPDESIDFMAMALQYEQNGSPGGSEAKDRRIGLLGNLNYTYDDRFLAEFAYRQDGSSQFGLNRRFAPFWSAGVGYNLHYENFIADNFLFIDRLKVKASYGSTGSTQFSAYQALATYGYIIGDRYKTWLGTQRNELGNPDLEWQNTGKYNVGVELGLFKSRVTMEANYFYEKTSNLLSSLELPYSNGFTSYNENIGSLQQRGIELMATVWLVRSNRQRFSWSVSGNIIYNTDKIDRLSEAMKVANEKLALQGGAFPNTIIRQGDSRNTIYVVPSLGIDPSTGRELFLNRFGGVTYSWDPRDRVAAGLDQPKYRGNFSTLVRYGNLTFNASFGFRFGGQLYNRTLIEKIENADKLFNVDERVFNDRWIQPGDRAAFRGINEVVAINASSRFVQDENTLICQNLNLNYDLYNKAWLKKMGLQSLSLAANTGELFYISTVRQERGLDYPFTRQFSLVLYAAF
ncbi:MAG: SusC/RagA family TonB-linked outer membrane protein [Candidatus Pseudobacter hemicellulosilyticus]|uniref:SusC/RagA family TonB-linked outer membrane protein n=1 Tax=Candidatus Pseudobacter hemicellulosilyticus TaxID=3121375 RepID=A0AAJ5WNN5_9BACT|nr:MAG: SusC/RagA family TonB-linked outer membrane protein [Pseudobacter sp.]